jgi:hypothetical protein
MNPVTPMVSLRPVLTILTVLTVPTFLAAQVRASEPAMVAQTIDGTRLTVEYSRPRARNRDSLFGKIITWGEVWTPGANWATTLEVSKDVKVNDKPLAAGKYSVWFVVRKTGPWTVVLDPRDRLFHMAHPDSTASQVRFDVTPTTVPFSEALTWSFRDLHAAGTTLAMEWGTVRVPINVSVASSFTLTTPADKAAPYLGTYTFVWNGGPGTGKPIKLFITHENGSLMGRWDPAPFPEWERFLLIARGPDTFIPGFLESGKLYDVEPLMPFEFTMEAGHAIGFAVRGETGQAMGEGKRMP